jgi:hypothetical protein
MIKMKTPRKDEKNISWQIYKNLKNGVKSRNELLLKIINYFKDNNITHNSKGKEITPEGILSNINEILRYIFASRAGWYKDYFLDESDNELKIKYREVTWKKYKKEEKLKCIKEDLQKEK